MPQLSDYLLRHGLIKAGQLDQAREYRKTHGGGLGTGVLKMGLLSREALALAGLFFLAAAFSVALSAQGQEPETPRRAGNPPIQASPAEVELYERAKTLMDWTPRQIAAMPVFRKLRPPTQEDQLSRVLERAGQTVALLLQDFPQVACDEELNSEATVLGASGQPSKFRESKFRYIVIPEQIGDLRAFKEYRTDLNGNPIGVGTPSYFFMITTNFVATALYLNAAQQADSHFRYFGMQTIRSRECHVVGFAQNPEKARFVGLLYLQGKRVVLLNQGLVWIDSETSQILRVTTWLLAPRTDIGLRSESSTVDFFPVQLSGSAKALWLPRDVKVEGVYGGMWFRNTHHYSHFKLFRVESTIKPGP